MTKTQREYFLREQLKAIQQELGQFDEVQAEVDEYTDEDPRVGHARGGRRRRRSRSSAASRRCRRRPPRRASSAPTSTGSSACRGPTSPRRSSTSSRRKRILDEDHYGLEKVKERILEYLAVHKLTDKMRGPILCFVGPSGRRQDLDRPVDRAGARAASSSACRSAACATRPRSAVTGARTSARCPGRIIQSISQVGTKQPGLHDGRDRQGRAPTSAATRPRRCSRCSIPSRTTRFQDHYLEAPFDLSNVMFITTANLLDTIPPALRDRMEVIHFPGYTEDEKLHIARAVPRSPSSSTSTG